MKTTTFGVAAALALGLISFAAPASAVTPTPAGIVAEQPMTDVSSQRVVRRTVIRRGPVCTMRTVVRRGPMGRRVVTKTRVCR